MIENKRQRIEISVETHEIKTIRIRGGAANSAYCPRCQAETSVFSSEQIAALLKISDSEVCRDIETGKFHLIESEGAAFICGGSMRR